MTQHHAKSDEDGSKGSKKESDAKAVSNPANIVVRAEWARLRLWQIQFVRDVAVILLICGVLWFGYELSIVTVPLLLAIFLAYLIEPLVKRAVRTGKMSRQGVATGVIAVVGVGVVLPAILGLGVAVVQGVQYTATMGENVTLLVQSAVNEPANKDRRDALAAKGPLWIRIRDYIVTQEAKYQQVKQRDTGVKAPVEEEPRSGKPGDEIVAAAGDGVMQDVAATSGGPAAEPEVPADVPMETSPETGRRTLMEKPTAVYSLIRAGLKWAEENAGSISGKVLQGGTGVAGVIAGFAAGTAGRVGGFFFGAFLTAFFFFFICTGWGRVLSFWQSLIPERKQTRVVALVGKMDEVIAGFVRGRITICAILMVFYTVGYFLIGVPAWLLMGPLMGALVLVPYAQGVGAPVAMLLMALQPASGIQGQWWWIIAAPLVLLTIGQFLDDYVLTPRIQGKSTNMDTPTILFASIAGGSLAGVYGLLVAIPVAACIKILLKEAFWPRFKAWAEGRERDFLPLER